MQFMRYLGGSNRRHQQRLTDDVSHALELSQHLYEAGNDDDSFQEMRILCTPCSTWDAAADGISDGLQDGTQPPTASAKAYR